MVNVTRPEVERLIAEGLDPALGCEKCFRAEWDHSAWKEGHAFAPALTRRLALALEEAAQKVDAVRALPVFYTNYGGYETVLSAESVLAILDADEGGGK